MKAFVSTIDIRPQTWVALLAAKEVLSKGGRVLWWDFEDKPGGLFRRVRGVGALDLFKSESLAFVDSGLKDNPDMINLALISAVEWLAQVEHNLVVIDTAASSGAPSDGASIVEWESKVVKPFVHRDVTVLILDHVPKRRQDRPRGPIGSIHKLSELDGVGYMISGKPWNKTQDGAMTLTLDKDKQGDIPGTQGQRIATIKGQHRDGVICTSIGVPGKGEDDDVDDMAMILLIAIADKGPEGVRGARNLRALIKGNHKAKDDAIQELIADELVLSTKAGQAFIYTLTDNGRAYLADEGL